MSANDYAFGIGDRVVVGTQPGTIKGQANEEGYPDTFKIEFMDDDGFPFRREFAEHFIAKARAH